MTECLIQKNTAGDDDMKMINSFSRRELSANEVYTFNVTLCNNDIDRDYEKFSVDALHQMAKLFVGKTGICDHSMSSNDQKARIYYAYVVKCDGKLTADGEPLYELKAKAYMLNNDANKTLIEEIDAGIKKEVSVSCSMSSCRCSICGRDKRRERCEHINGKSYNGKLCFSVLSDAQDAYEFSFVAVPAQREAGVTKSFDFKENINMDQIIKAISSCENDFTITKAQARELADYIGELKDEASLGEEYKKQLAGDVVRLFSKSFPNLDATLVSSVASVMTTKELLGFKKGMSQSLSTPKPQLSVNEKMNNNSYSQFKI